MPQVERRLSLSFEKIPLYVRLPMRMYFSISASISDTHTTMRTIPASPAKNAPTSRKLKMEIARKIMGNDPPGFHVK